MTAPPSAATRGAEVVVPCVDFDATLEFFVERLGFRLELILPADAPRTARLSGHGLSVRLERADVAGPVRLRLPPEAACWAGTAARHLDGPGGVRIEHAGDDTAVVLPAPACAIAI